MAPGGVILNFSELAPNSTRNDSSSETLDTSCHRVHSLFMGDWRSIVDVVVFLALCAANGFVLCVILRKEHLRTPFTVYLVNILCTNLVCSVLTFLVDMAVNLACNPKHNRLGCFFQLYGTHTTELGMWYGHALVTLNRLWALRFPLSYRNRHSKKLAWVLVLSTWFLVNLWTLPALVVDALHHRESAPNSTTCVFNIAAQRTWYYISGAFSIIPQIIVIGAFPYIWWVRRKQSQEKRKLHVAPLSDFKTEEMHSSAPVSDEKHGHAELHSRGFLVLSFLTVSILITWSIQMVDFWPDSAMETNSAANYAVFYAYHIQYLLDPVLLTAALPDVQMELRRIVCIAIPRRFHCRLQAVTWIAWPNGMGHWERYTEDGRALVMRVISWLQEKVPHRTS